MVTPYTLVEFTNVTPDDPEFMQRVRATVKTLETELPSALARIDELKLKLAQRTDLHDKDGKALMAALRERDAALSAYDRSEAQTEALQTLLDETQNRLQEVHAESMAVKVALLEMRAGIDRDDQLPCWCPSPTLARWNRSPNNPKRKPENAGHVQECAKNRAVLGYVLALASEIKPEGSQVPSETELTS